MGLSLSFGRWDLYILVLARVSAALGVAPVLSSRAIPVQVKVGLSVLLTILIAPIHAAQLQPIGDWAALGVAVLKEVVVGLLMGFSASLVFSAVQVATKFMGVQLGVAMAGTIDPLWTESGTFLETFYGMLAALIFFTVGGHYALIAAIAGSFDIVPLGTYTPAAVTSDRLIAVSGTALATGISLAMPVVGAVLLTDVAMGVLVRSIPQINIFAVNLPLKMLVGLVAMAGLMPWSAAGMAEVSKNVGAVVVAVLR